MKKTYALLLAACASAALFTASGFAAPEPKCPVCGGATAKTAKPYPIKVVHPTELPRTFYKSTINVELTVDEYGTPSGVRTVGRVDRKVAERVVSAVSQWRFSPMYVDGVPVTQRVVLPIELTPVEGA